MYNFNNDANNDNLTFDGRSIFRHIIYPVYYFIYGSPDAELAALDRKTGNAKNELKWIVLSYRKSWICRSDRYSSVTSFSYVIREHSSDQSPYCHVQVNCIYSDRSDE